MSTLRGSKRLLVRRLICASAILAAVAPSAFGEEPPQLPASAVRLAGASILELYDGQTFAFESVTFHGRVTGEVIYDFTSGTNRGTWQLGSRTGSFDGKIRIARDRFCYMAGPRDERCNYVYRDAEDIYEVKQSGIVDSVKRKK